MLLAALLGAMIGGTPVTQPQLGAPYPGAASVGRPERRGCGIRYRFRTEAPADAVAAFYLSQGKTAGLSLVKESGTSLDDTRMIDFGEKGPGRLLFVMIDKGSPVTGTVYVVRARSPGCDER